MESSSVRTVPGILARAVLEDRPLRDSELPGFRRSLGRRGEATIHPGCRLEDAAFHGVVNGSAAPIKAADIFSGKVVVLFGLPGLFAPAEQQAHISGYAASHEAFLAGGADLVACAAVTTSPALAELARTADPHSLLLHLADEQGAFASFIGVALDSWPFHLGIRSKRYALVVADWVVKSFAVEPDPARIEASSAAATLKLLREIMREGP
jgi:peroxiredoxin